MDHLRAAAIREKREKNDPSGPPVPPDFGFHYPFDYVQTAASILKSSQWSSWPNGSGWANEDSALIEDVLLYFSLERRAEWEAEHGIVSTQVARESVTDSNRKYRLGSR